jgi:adenine-specific DNA-methyltransferase
MNSTAVDEIRLQASRCLDPERRSALGQFMTPSAIARFMAGLFSPSSKAVRLLDAGAGVGSLTSAFVDAHPGVPIQVEAWELDATLRSYLETTLSGYAAKKTAITSTIHADDFIEASVWNLSMGTGPRFTHAILNPPYKKIGSASRHRLLLRQVGIETVNLYSAFLALAILLMEPGGEIVAIVPRSFCNGTYYRPFRRLLLDHCAIRQIHVFGARDKAFSDDDVLQENIIIKLVRGGEQGDVTVSDCHDGSFSDYRESCFGFDRIVKAADQECFIHVPSLDAREVLASPLFAHTLKEIGLEVCTGPVVDFRLRDHCRAQPEHGTVPLLYAHHFAGGRLAYPVEHKKKPNAIADNEQTRKWLMPRGHYVLTRRFSAKEERRRVVAFVLDPEELPAALIGFENHLNVFHVGKHGMDGETAYGLALFLNSTLVDACFRAFSGHTQVNATDLRQMRYPSWEQLKAFGRWAGRRQLTQIEIDDYILSAVPFR